MGNTWGRKVPLKEVLRKNKREINKAVRELDRERANLEKQEQKLVADIKKYAKDGQMVGVGAGQQDDEDRKPHRAHDRLVRVARRARCANLWDGGRRRFTAGQVTCRLRRCEWRVVDIGACRRT